VTVLEESQDKLILGVPNFFFKSWLEEHYGANIKDIARRHFQKEIEIEFIILQPKKSAPPPLQLKPKTVPEMARPHTQINDLNQKYTFANFVIGVSNRFAHAASLAVAESPGRAYNPLFIYGGVGLGKTHLMQAIGRYIKEKNSSLKLLYVPSERYVNDFIEAIQTRTIFRFRQMYRHVDILLVDDIHFIAGKESTQEEFFHTFNALYDTHKQIVVTSDRPPKDIKDLEERITSRFAWGLVADIQPPDLETRIAILRHKVKEEKWSLPNEIIDFIAQRIKFNIRTLEGALNRVMAHASLTKTPLSLENAKEILRDSIPEEGQKQITLNLIQQKVSEFFDLRMTDLLGARRNKTVALPRQIAMYICRQLTPHSLPEIGESFGNRDHTTVLHACKNIAKKAHNDKELSRTINKIIEIIRE
jgi:chromosomal replication initiator protein